MDTSASETRISSRDILIQTENIEAASSFYQQKLGFAVFMSEKDIIGLEAGAFRLFIERGTPYGPVFEFFAEDLSVAKEKLTESGCQIDIEDDSVPKCYVRDPFGLTFNIAQR